LQAIFLEKAFFQNESVLKVGLNWVFFGPTFGEETQKDSISFSVIKKFGWETQVTNALSVQTHFLFLKNYF
jgi:hypothetical protein